MELFDLALQSTTDEFHRESLRWVEGRIGFDGVIWGHGERQGTGAIAISDFLLSGRPEGLIADYPTAAAADPVSLRFLAAPTALQNVSTHALYRPASHGAMRAYLDHYRVRHLQLMGSVAPGGTTYSWIVCYREEQGRAFSPASEPLARNAIAIILLAEQLHHAARAQVALEKAVFGRQAVCTGYERLTPRQLQILHYIEQGWSNKLIAHHLSISGNTLKSHIKLLFRTLGVSSRGQAMVAGKAMRSNLHKGEQCMLR